MSTVSVVVPCYKYGHYLRDCVRSVLDQQGVDVRVLVIDDASPDDTARVARSLVSTDGRVQFRRHEENSGHIRTYNEGLGWIDGDYSLLLSADDVLIPGALARAAEVLDTHPEVGFTYGKVVYFEGDDPPGRGRPHPAEAGWHLLAGAEFLRRVCESGHNPVPTPTVVVRTDLQKRLGGYRHQLPHSGDLEMWLRFAAHSCVGVLDADQAYQRKHARNMNLAYRGLEDLRQRRDAFETLFREHRDRIPDCDRLRAATIRKVAEDAFWEACSGFERGEVASSRELLDFGLGLDPTLALRPEWSRMRWKRRLGPTAWNLLRPIVDRARRAFDGSGPRRGIDAPR